MTQEKVIEQYVGGLVIDRTAGFQPGRKAAPVSADVECRPSKAFRTWWVGKVTGHLCDADGRWTGISRVLIVDTRGYLNLRSGEETEVAFDQMRRPEVSA